GAYVPRVLRRPRRALQPRERLRARSRATPALRRGRRTTHSALAGRHPLRAERLVAHGPLPRRHHQPYGVLRAPSGRVVRVRCAPVECGLPRRRTRVSEAEPAKASADTPAEDAPALPERIGDYAVERLLGEGGM